MTTDEWIAAYAGALQVAPPTDTEIARLLDLASVAAHASARLAAPLSCWIAAKAACSTEEALSVAQHLADGGT